MRSELHLLKNSQGSAGSKDPANAVQRSRINTAAEIKSENTGTYTPQTDNRSNRDYNFNTNYPNDKVVYLKFTVKRSLRIKFRNGELSINNSSSNKSCEVITDISRAYWQMRSPYQVIRSGNKKKYHIASLEVIASNRTPILTATSLNETRARSSSAKISWNNAVIDITDNKNGDAVFELRVVFSDRENSYRASPNWYMSRHHNILPDPK